MTTAVNTNTAASGATNVDVATDTVGGALFQKTLQADPVTGLAIDPPLRADLLALATVSKPYSPGYARGDEGGAPLGTDPDGNLLTRGPVLTDEGTFRINFANSSLAVSIGSCTVSGAAVTGTFADTLDLHAGDYVKFDADPESAWTQVESRDSGTGLTLVSSYLGAATSGAMSRALVRPYTGSGGAIAVASGQSTLTLGSTTSAITGLGRVVDYAPLVFRARVSVSQRVANQDILIGMREDATTARWFARFRLNGATNTTVSCETGRNPTTSPSASETETTTLTLPNGATTAAMRDYRIELLTEQVVFYVDAVEVARHARVIPATHDEMAAVVEGVNGTSPTTGTVVTIDYLTAKNHNKVEIGVLSDAEKVQSALVPPVVQTYSVTGVIAINTDLLIIDCRQLASLAIHIQSLGTTGVITAAWCNDTSFAVPVTATLYSESGATSTTQSAAGLRTVNRQANFLRLRLTTATTAGTTTAVVAGYTTPINPPIATQPVSGTVTANIGTGSLAAGANLIGDASIQYRAGATGAANKVHRVSTGTDSTSVKASAGKVVGWRASNTNAAYRYVKLHNTAGAVTAGSGVVETIAIPPLSTASGELPGGSAFSTGIGFSMVTGSADSDATAVAAGDVILDIFYA